MGLSVQKDKVTEELGEKLQKLCPFGAISYDGKNLSIGMNCKGCKLCVKNSDGAIVYEEENVPSVNKKEWNGMHDMETIADLCLELGAIDVLLIDTEERSASVWSARSAFLEAIKGSTDMMDECDVVVPRSLVADYILYTHEVAEKVGLRIPSFGHAGDGNLHIYLCRDGKSETEWVEKKGKAFDLLYKKSSEIGGMVSGEHGIGLDKKEYLREVLGDSQMEIMRGIKKVFDPNGILNPGKVV